MNISLHRSEGGRGDLVDGDMRSRTAMGLKGATTRDAPNKPEREDFVAGMARILSRPPITKGNGLQSPPKCTMPQS